MRLFRNLFLLSVLLLGFNSLVGQSNTLLQFHQFTTDEGLSQSTNEFLYQDERGFTWIGSMAGLNRFDGREVDIFTHNDTAACSMKGLNIQSQFFEDAIGNIWFTTEQALNCYEQASGCLRQVYLDGDPDNTGKHYAFHLEQGRFLWIEALGKVYRFDTQQDQLDFQQIIVDSTQLSRAIMITDEKGQPTVIYNALWGYGPGIEVITLRNGQRQSYFSTRDRTNNLQLTATQVLPIAGSEVCFLTNQGLLFFDHLAPDDYQLFAFPKNVSSVTHMVRVKDALFLVNNTGYISRFTLAKDERGFSNQQVRAFNLDERKFMNNIYRIFLTADSTLWLAEKNRGVHFANLKNTESFAVFGQNELSAQVVQSVIRVAPDEVWAVAQVRGTPGEVFSFTSEKQLLRRCSIPAYFSVVQSTEGTVWGGASRRGLAPWSGTKFSWGMYPFPQAGTSLYTLIPTPEESLLLGTQSGVYQFDTELKRYTLLTGYRGFAWKLFLDSRDRLWIDNLMGKVQVYQFDATSYSLTPITSFSNISLMNDCIEDTAGRIWMATPHGLKRFDTSGNDLTMHQINLPISDFNPYLKGLALTKEDLWISTNDGVLHCQFTADTLRLLRHYQTSNGLSANEYQAGARAIESEGKVWFGSTRGLDVMFEQKLAYPPRTAIKSLWINNSDTPWSSSAGETIANQNELTLKHYQNTLSFSFAAIEYTNPQANKIKIFLRSENKLDSTIINSDERIHYTNLKPGNYEVLYTASNSEGQWQSPLQQLALTIHPPWYQTLWFKMLAFITLLAIILTVVVLYYRYLLRMKDLELDRVRILAAERQRIAADMHDHLNTELAHLRLKSLSTARKDNIEDLRNGLLEVSKVSRFLVYEIKDLIWTLTPRGGNLEGLVVKIIENTNKFMEAAEIKRTIKQPDQLPALKISSTARYNINYTVKELVLNVVRYAEATALTLDISLVSNRLVILLADNGKGFDFEEAKERSNGIGNCIRRMAALNGTIKWNDNHPSGTLVVISLDLDDLK